jgi:hypothetical protein
MKVKQNNHNLFKHYVNIGYDKKIYKAVKDGLSIAEAGRALDIHTRTALSLYKHHSTQIKTDLINNLKESIIITFDEMTLGGESYKSLYIPYYEEKQTVTKMSKV